MSFTQYAAGYPDFPMNNISWIDCIKWCNARSEFMGRKAVYYTDSTNQVFRAGELHFQINQIILMQVDTDCQLKRSGKGRRGKPAYSLDYP